MITNTDANKSTISDNQNVSSRKTIKLYFLLICAVALAVGFSESVYTNYYKEVYEVTAFQRGFIEFPRELPGVLCAFVIASLAFLGDIKIAIIAQSLALVGLLCMGLFTPTFGGMLVFLFINSLGNHLFMPLQDAIGMSLAQDDNIGKRVGQYTSTRSLMSFIAGLGIFFGFRYNIFSFESEIKWVFLLGCVFHILALVAVVLLVLHTKKTAVAKSNTAKKFKFIFRKEYKYYYLLSVLHGVQKQIALVYGSWAVVDLLVKGADTMAMLTLIASLLGVFFTRMIGKWIDRFGVRKMMFVDALSFIGVYVLYGFAVWGICDSWFGNNTLATLCIYTLFIADRLSMQIGVVKSIYLRSIAVTKDEITSTISTGISLDHVVSIIAALASGYIWTNFGSQWVFFLAAAFSVGNLYVAFKIKEPA